MNQPATGTINQFKADRRLWMLAIAIVAAVVTFIGGAAFLLAFKMPSSVPLPISLPSNVAVAHRGDLHASVNAAGKVRSKRSARLALPLSGVVAAIDKVEGDNVNMGDVILTLRAEETARRAKQAEINLQTRQLELSRAKGAPRQEDIDIARANLRKATVSVAAAEAAYNAAPTSQNGAAQELARADLEIARANFNRLTNGPTKEEVDALQNAVTIAQLELDGARAALAQAQVTAPFTATVTEINVREDELVGAFTPLASIAQLNTLEIAVEIDEIDVAHAEPGQSVELSLDAFPGERFAGNLVRLFPAATNQRGSTVYNAIVEFDPRNFKVRLGMGASLKIQTIERKDALLVPNRALKNVGTRKAVHIISPGEPRDVIVETGLSDGNQTEIVSGLNEGDQVSLQ